MFIRLPVVALVIAGILICANMGGSTENGNATGDGICRTPNCQLIARKILNGMNPAADPCHNFYDYMCGKWSDENPVPAYENTWSAQSKIKDAVDQQLREIVEEPERSSDSLPLHYAKRWYRSCMDVEALEAQGVQPINRILNQYGGWPLALENWTGLPENLTWQILHDTYRRQYDTSAFYNINLRPESIHSDTLIIAIDQRVAYPMNFNFAENQNAAGGLYQDTEMGLIRQVISTFIQANGASIDQRIITMEVLNVYFLSLELQEIGYIKRGTEHYERMTISELQNWYDALPDASSNTKIDWLARVRQVFNDTALPIDGSTVVEVNNKDALYSLRKLLDTTPLRVIVNYIHWDLVAQLMPYTNGQMSDLFYKATKVTETQNKPRWKTCLMRMELKDALSIEFVKTYANPRTTVKVRTILTRIQATMKRRVSRSKFLSDQAKEFVTRKLNNILTLVGYPAWYHSDDAVNNYYHGLTVGPNYLENLINYRKYELKNTMKLYGKQFDKSSWFQFPITVNAFYYQQANSIVLPLAQYFRKVFEPPVPEAINYASIGFIIGHELAHTFIGRGLNYDERGNKVSTPIRITNQEHKGRINCFVLQYNNYTLEGSPRSIHANGAQSKFENIADYFGIAMAYDVYRKFMGKRDRTELRLPGLEDYTDEQLFFMSFASDWCYTSRANFEEHTFNSNEHLPMKYRMLGVLSNTASFAAAFNCPANSRMNPEHKCKLV